MAKPEEVLVVEKDGEVIREVIKDTDAMEQYKFMRQTLVYVLDCVMFSCLTRAHKLALVGMCAVTATSVLHCSNHGRFHLCMDVALFTSPFCVRAHTRMSQP